LENLRALHQVVLLNITTAARPVTRGAQGSFAPWKNVFGHILKLLDVVKKFGPLSENFSLRLVSQAGYGPDCCTTQ